MARALIAYRASHGAAALPLMSTTLSPAPCDWPRYGLHLATVTKTEFRAATAGASHDTGYIAHLTLGRPRYSLLHLRAVADVGSHYGWLGGDGEDCQFQLWFNGWRLQQCRAAWIS